MKSFIQLNLLVKKAIKYAAEDLIINNPEIIYWDQLRFPQKCITSMYLPNEKVIVFNIDWLKKADIADILIVCFHEVRHAYQWNEIKTSKNTLNKTNEDAKTVILWEQEFNNYLQPNTSTKDYNYEKQAIETDAINYAIKLIKKILAQ